MHLSRPAWHARVAEHVRFDRRQGARATEAKLTFVDEARIPDFGPERRPMNRNAANMALGSPQRTFRVAA